MDRSRGKQKPVHFNKGQQNKSRYEYTEQNTIKRDYEPCMAVCKTQRIYDVGGSQNGMGKYEVESANETLDRAVLFPQCRRD